MRMFFWKAAGIGIQIDRASETGVRRAAKRILARANERVPFREGHLKDSGDVSTDGSRAVIAYHTAYAARLHQHPEYNFNPPGEGRWLLNAIEDANAQHAALKEMAVPFRDSLGRFARRPG